MDPARKAGRGHDDDAEARDEAWRALRRYQDRDLYLTPLATAGEEDGAGAARTTRRHPGDGRHHPGRRRRGRLPRPIVRRDDARWRGRCAHLPAGGVRAARSTTCCAGSAARASPR